MASRHYFGLVAEYFIIALYRIKFYQILQHRMRNYAGEIDLIALRGKNIVFIEVKARSTYDNYCDHILQHRQQQRITRAAQLFLAYNPKYQHYQSRFDLAIVMPYKLPIIIKNAW